MTLELILLIIGGYLMGSIPSAYLAARWGRKIDIRQYGSGNVGAANVVKVGARWLGVAVIFFDIGKVMPAVGVAYLLGLTPAQQMVIGVAAVVGHNWPVFLRFSGGRGIAAIMGVALIMPLLNGLMIPWALIAFLAIMIANIVTFRVIPVASIIAVGAMPIVSWAVDEPLSFALGFLAMFLIMIIRRLTPRRTRISAKVPTGELLLNRFLFDRDIRDREAWIHQDRNGPEKEAKD
jgi:glycerol-3-phosphate acyltransferase PlsY